MAGVERVGRVGVHVHDRHPAERAREVEGVRLAALDDAACRTPLAENLGEGARRALELHLDDAPAVRGGAVYHAGEFADVRADVKVGDVKDGLHRR